MSVTFARRHPPASAWGLVLLVFLVTGCAGARQARQERHVEQATAILQTRANADSLAAAGLLSYFKSHEQALSLLLRASAAAPERADLLWLQLGLCGMSPPCDAQPLELRLRAVDPANGIGWLGELSRARMAKDDAAMDAVLIALGRSERVDSYWNSLVGRLASAATSTNKLPLVDAMITVTGLVSAIAVPAYSPVSSACKGDRLQRAEILQACRGVAVALENGDTEITEMIGVAIAKRVWPEDSPQWRAAAERRRVHDYRAELWRPLGNRLPWSASKTARYVALCVDTRREQDVIRSQLIEAGKAADPPPM